MTINNLPTNVTVTWDFGDGSPSHKLPLVFTTLSASHRTMVVPHVYTSAGDFNVNVVLTNFASSLELSTVVF